MRALRERAPAVYVEDSDDSDVQRKVSDSKNGVLRFAFNKGSTKQQAAKPQPRTRGRRDSDDSVVSDSSDGDESLAQRRSKRAGPSAKLTAPPRERRGAAVAAAARTAAQMAGSENDEEGSDSEAEADSSEDEEEEADTREEESASEDEQAKSGSEDAIEMSEDDEARNFADKARPKAKAGGSRVAKALSGAGTRSKAKAVPPAANAAPSGRPQRLARRAPIIEEDDEGLSEGLADDDSGAGGGGSSSEAPSSDDSGSDAGGSEGEDGDVVEVEGAGGGDLDARLDKMDVARREAAATWTPAAPKGHVSRVVRRDPDNENKFVAKLKGLSWRNLGTVTMKQIDNQNRTQLLRNFLHKGEDFEVEEEWTQVERVIDHKPRNTKQGRVMDYLVKWKGLDYGDATWEDERSLVEDETKIREYHKRIRRPDASKQVERHLDTAKTFDMPEFRSKRALRDYQEVSVRWMIANYRTHKSCILGDEMGLGKTAQSIACLEVMRRIDGVRGPFLLVAPLTTLGHWQREIQTWTDINCVLYTGTAEDREVIQDTELFFGEGRPRGKMFLPGDVQVEALLVSYEMLLKDIGFFRKFVFAAGVFDEAHKLKGINSSTRAAVQELSVAWKLLLTGTPIQNNLSELFSMLNLLDSDEHPDLETFTNRFGDGTAGSTTQKEVGELKEVLKPILLRRMKEDVEKLPEKEEVIVWVQLTAEQRAYYKALYENQIGALLGGVANKNLPQMRNLAMELRKLCNHPFLCESLEEDIVCRRSAMLNKGMSERELIESASGKMVMLGKLLPKLRAEGRRVLIFSQFKIMLNVLEDYMRTHGWPVERIDGDVKQRDRQASIDRYTNGTLDESFIFLLSTRAGGQGITLTVADTCIIYDSDWNPQNDLQAMARCHRIGQEKEVTVYRLISKDTYEEQLFSTASKKYGLDEAILGGGGDSGDPEQDSARIASLLKHGAHALMAGGESGDAAGAQFQNENIDQILASRTEKRSIGSKAGNSFSVATFVHEETGGVGPSDPEYWAKLMPQAAQAFREKEARAKAGLSNVIDVPRSRRKVDYTLGGVAGKATLFGKTKGRGRDSDDEFAPGQDGPDSDFEMDDAAGGEKEKPGRKAVPKQRVWMRRDTKALEEKLLVMGVGRWDELRTALVDAKPSGLSEETPVEEVEALGKTVAALIKMAADGTRSLRAAAALRAAHFARLGARDPLAVERTGAAAGSAAPSRAASPERAAAAAMDVDGVGTVERAGAAAAAEAPPTEEEVTALMVEAMLATARGTCPAAAAAVVLVPENMKRYLNKSFAAAKRWEQLQEAGQLSALLAAELPEGQRFAGWKNGRCPKSMHGQMPHWWTEAMDDALLRGCAKNGMAGMKKVAEAILDDPSLGFKDIVVPAPDAALDGDSGWGEAGDWRREELHEVPEGPERDAKQTALLELLTADHARLTADHARKVRLAEAAPPPVEGADPAAAPPPALPPPTLADAAPTPRPHALPPPQWAHLVGELARRIKVVHAHALNPPAPTPEPAPPRAASAGGASGGQGKPTAAYGGLGLLASPAAAAVAAAGQPPKARPPKAAGSSSAAAGSSSAAGGAPKRAAGDVGDGQPSAKKRATTSTEGGAAGASASSPPHAFPKFDPTKKNQQRQINSFFRAVPKKSGDSDAEAAGAAAARTASNTPSKAAADEPVAPPAPAEDDCIVVE
ncbi:hypothetical protein FOA52_000297 [Chlamydomonas sp. UWO 241]|nr:hypothetical protein FOA52_000297 [Chlamydomonas sp. UWO 241]